MNFLMFSRMLACRFTLSSHSVSWERSGNSPCMSR